MIFAVSLSWLDKGTARTADFCGIEAPRLVEAVSIACERAGCELQQLTGVWAFDPDWALHVKEAPRFTGWQELKRSLSEIGVEVPA